MRRVFLGVWLAAAVLFGLGMIAHEVVVVWLLYSEDEAAYYDQFIEGGLLVTADRVWAADDRGAALAHAERRWGVPVTVVALEDVPASVLGELGPEGELAWADGADGGVFYVRSASGLDVLRLGPFAAVPWPNPLPRLALFLGLTLLFGAAFWAILRPLDRAQGALSRTALAIAGGALDARVDPADAPAAPAMASAFNTMAERVETLVRGQQDALRTASHELRTPIARLRIGLHLLANAAEDRQAKADALDADLAELDDLVDEILVHARLESGGETRPKEPVPLGAVARDVVEAHAGLDPSVSVSFDSGLDAVPHVDGVPGLLRRLVGNLVGNAVRYAEREVRVGGGVREGFVELWVDDDGPGVPEDLRGEVLLPFRAMGEAGGHGMGLAIVARIARWHGGDVVVEAGPLGGCRVRVWLPV